MKKHVLRALLFLAPAVAALAQNKPLPNFFVQPPSAPTQSTEERDFPQDVPRYLPASSASYRIKEEFATAYLETADSPEKVEAFYAAFAKRGGWTSAENNVTKRRNGRVLIYRKGPRIVRADAITNPLDHLTEIYLTVTMESTADGGKPDGGRR
jgi:hypothetical protein